MASFYFSFASLGKIAALVLSAFAAIALSMPIRAQSGSLAPVPADFVSNVGGFRIKFPATPKSDTGGVSPHFILTKGGVVYFVGYQDYPRPITAPPDIKSIFEVARTQAVSDGEKLLSEREFKVDGAPGREFVTDDARAQFTTRVILAGRRVYKVIAGVKKAAGAVPTPNANGALVTTFLDSFHLLNRPEDRTAYASESVDEPVLMEGMRGSVEGNLYRNDVLSMTMQLPDGWQVVDEKQFAYANNRGGRSAGTGGVDDSVDRSLRNTAHLVAVSKYAFGTPRNATMVVSLERLADPSRDARTVAASALAAMKAELPLRVTKDVYMTRAGGVELASFTTALDLADGVFRQSYFVTIRRGQAITIVFSYVYDDDGLTLEKSLLSIRMAGRR